ncbi:MAG: MBL fold metallo-hydrolase [Balneolaceae bacterium]|nr:MBL fold metallo-hydrolase [Balneolaceae bacterium]
MKIVLTRITLFIACIIFFAAFLVSCTKESTSVSEGPDTKPDPNEYTPVTVTSDWYEVTYISPKTYVIKEPSSSQLNNSYLLLGDDEAFLLDTGSGENTPKNGSKMKHLIDQITDLPVTLLLSHFHFDHNQNIGEFERVAFPDLPFLRDSVSADSIYNFTSEDLFYGSQPDKTKVSRWLPLNTEVDLGGRVVQFVNLPGHTDESTIIIDKTNRMVFLGDYLYNGALFVFDEEDLSIYETSVAFLKANISSEYRLYGAHGTPKIPYNRLQMLEGLLGCIETNACQPSSVTVFGYPAKYYTYDMAGMVVLDMSSE